MEGYKNFKVRQDASKNANWSMLNSYCRSGRNLNPKRNGFP